MPTSPVLVTARSQSGSVAQAEAMPQWQLNCARGNGLTLELLHTDIAWMWLTLP